MGPTEDEYDRYLTDVVFKAPDVVRINTLRKQSIRRSPKWRETSDDHLHKWLAGLWKFYLRRRAKDLRSKKPRDDSTGRIVEDVKAKPTLPSLSPLLAPPGIQDDQRSITSVARPLPPFSVHQDRGSSVYSPQKRGHANDLDPEGNSDAPPRKRGPYRRMDELTENILDALWGANKLNEGNLMIYLSKKIENSSGDECS
jgi:hypothetical protein